LGETFLLETLPLTLSAAWSPEWRSLCYSREKQPFFNCVFL